MNICFRKKKPKNEDEINCEDSTGSSESECTKILKETEILDISSEEFTDEDTESSSDSKEQKKEKRFETESDKNSEEEKEEDD